jgi:methyl-accepting chemotaxis protein/sigma-B regulation protein RsbU (phosphoserine phosphatase)
LDRNGKSVGVLAVDVAIELLSQIVLAAKPSPNGYSTLLGRNGSYIVHPDVEKLRKQNVFNQFAKDSDPSMRKVVKSMVGGESGQAPFIMDGNEWYVVYKPFTRHEVVGRTTDHLGWSVGVVYPKDDIFGDYNRLLYLVIGIAFVGLLLSIILSSLFTHRKLFPLNMLTKAAQKISQGDYSRTIPDTERYDEIGLLQKDFQQLQQSLATRMAELEQMNAQLKERSEELQQANRKAQEADRMKTAFLHQMTYQMLEPAESLKNHVATLCDNYQTISPEEASQEVKVIHQQGKTIVELLRHMIDSADQETGKEDAHE